MLALHLDNFLFLLFVAIVIFFQILTKAASKAGRRSGPTQPRSTPSPPTGTRSRGTVESDEEQIRKFLEALGQPTTSKPPEAVQPRPTYQKPIVMPPVPRPLKSPLPPLKTKPPDLPRQIRLPGQIPATRQARTFQPRTEPTVFEVHDVTKPLEAPAMINTPAEAYAAATRPVGRTMQRKRDIATLLGSTSDLREAIILREIFGPPRSFQPLDLVETF